MWNRLKTGCPFLPKQRFKYNVLTNTSCHFYNKDGDINPVSYRTEKKIYSFLTMGKERHVSCKQPTRGFFFFVLSNHLFSTTGSQLPLTSDDGTLDQKIVLKLFDHAFQSADQLVRKPLILCEYTGDNYGLQRKGPQGVNVWGNQSCCHCWHW